MNPPTPTTGRLSRALPLVVAWPLFQNNLDSSMLATALPTMAGALEMRVLDLNLAITSYLLGLALCLPLSGWAADRWGARRVFIFAICLFSVAAVLCGLTRSLPPLIACRLLQGVGGALMLPASRMILLRHISASEMVRAMVWFTVPGAVARLVGPMFAGAIVTYLPWYMVFLVNLPFGAIGVCLALALLPADPPADAGAPRAHFDARGFVFLGGGFAVLAGVLEVGSRGLWPLWSNLLLSVLGAGLLVAYVRHERTASHPLIDLEIFRHRTYRIALLGAIPLRISIGAMPFMLPLLMQAGFGLSALQSGFITLAGAIGALGSRTTLSALLDRVGFRTLLITAAAGSAVCCLGYAMFSAQTPRPLMFALMLVGGMFNSTAMVALNSLAYSDVPRTETSHATTAATLVHQLSLMFGVALGAALLALGGTWRAGPGATLQAQDFPFAFVAMSLLIGTTILSLRRLRREDGSAMRGR